MKDKPNGAFLVRDAARLPGYYTLTLRKSGVNRLIRIMLRDGLYGFAEPLEFTSVVALVSFYKEHSLAPYSPKLDITLGMPVSRKQVWKAGGGGGGVVMVPGVEYHDVWEIGFVLRNLLILLKILGFHWRDF